MLLMRDQSALKCPEIDVRIDDLANVCCLVWPGACLVASGCVILVF